MEKKTTFQVPKTERHEVDAILYIRDRPFNLKGGGRLWFFVSFRIFFSDNTRVRIFISCRAKRNFFFYRIQH